MGAALKRIASALDERIAVALGADDDILERGHRPEQANVLERSREAGDRPFVCGQRGHVDAVDEDFARGRAIEPGHDIERRCLAAAVRADQGMHAPAPHLKIDLVHGFQAAETLAQAFNLQRHRASRNRLGAT